jgi:hypothetical protein
MVVIRGGCVYQNGPASDSGLSDLDGSEWERETYQRSHTISLPESVEETHYPLMVPIVFSLFSFPFRITRLNMLQFMSIAGVNSSRLV